jgi:RNA polymerase sigma-70 factor (ECF subfamily)
VESATIRGEPPQCMREAASQHALEAALIVRILAGETQLFHDLVRPYEKLVCVTIFAIVRNEAEDGAQETMINAFRYLADFRGESKFSTWLVTTATNKARARLRQ